jgi:tetratricopeptide (TPR) repeat protein
MGTVADPVQVKIDPKGKLRRGGLAELLGKLALVGATGVLDLGRKKLVRRVVLRDGRIDAVLSNAREDRFAEWLLDRLGDESFEGTRRARELLATAGDRPATARLALQSRLVTEEELSDRLREHVRELLAEADEWPDLAYEVTPGRIDLGKEPVADLPALAPALDMARAAVARRSAALPGGVVARAGAAEALEQLVEPAEAERALVEAAGNPVRPARLLDRLPAEGRQGAQQTLLALVRAGLLAAVPAPAVSEASAEAEADIPAGELDETELLTWLEAGEAERFEELLGVPRGAGPQEVRRAYYRTVRRYHPDRFLEGPLARYHGRVEQCFRLVNEALQVLIDPRARAERERRKSTAFGPTDTAKLAARLLEAARQEARQGRLTQAVRHLEMLVKNHGETPEHAVPLCLMLLSNPRRRAEAIPLLERLASQHPQHGGVAAALALAYQKTDQAQKAQSYIERAARLEPGSPILAVARGGPDAADKAAADPFLATLA